MRRAGPVASGAFFCSNPARVQRVAQRKGKGKRRCARASLTLIAGLVLAACSSTAGPSAADPTPTSTPVETPPPSVQAPSPSASPSVQPSFEPSDPSEWGFLADYARYGSRAKVLSDGLRARLWPGLKADVIVTLPSGTELIVWAGPVSTDGREWYNVGFHGIETDATPGGAGTGWVAGDFIEIGEADCPGTLDAGVLARMTDWALDACVDEVPPLEGQIDTCFEGPLTPFTYAPGWIYFSCTYLDELAIHFMPDYAGPEVERGDLVRVTGHLGFDTGQYGECTVDVLEPAMENQLAAEAQSWADSCQHRFVVEELTVTGHEDLPAR